MGITVDEGNKLLTVTSACHDESSGDLRLFGLIYQVHRYTNVITKSTSHCFPCLILLQACVNPDLQDHKQ